jgi:hypothetical protein
MNAAVKLAACVREYERHARNFVREKRAVTFCVSHRACVSKLQNNNAPSGMNGE